MKGAAAGALAIAAVTDELPERIAGKFIANCTA
jgi:hypothetical protein